MQVHISFDLGSRLPGKLPPAFARRIHVIGQRVTVHDAQAVPWSSVFALLREQGFSVPSSRLHQRRFVREPIACAICKAQLRPTLGLWIARSEPSRLADA